jgi:hypothetical protein
MAAMADSSATGKDTGLGAASIPVPQGKTGTLLLDRRTLPTGRATALMTALMCRSAHSPAIPREWWGASLPGQPGGGTLTLFESELEGIAAGTNISLAATSTITINDLADNNLNRADRRWRGELQRHLQHARQ